MRAGAAMRKTRRLQYKIQRATRSQEEPEQLGWSYQVCHFESCQGEPLILLLFVLKPVFCLLGTQHHTMDLS